MKIYLQAIDDLIKILSMEADHIFSLSVHFMTAANTTSTTQRQCQRSIETFNKLHPCTVQVDIICNDVTKHNGSISVETFVNFVWVTMGEKFLSNHISTKKEGKKLKPKGMMIRLLKEQ